MAHDAPDARDDDSTTDDDETGVTTRTKVLWIIGAAIGGYFIVDGLVGILG